MAKIFSTLFAMATAFSLSAETLPTTMIGGGSDFLIVDAVDTPSVVTVNSGTTGNYAGIDGGMISYTFKSAEKEDITAFNIKADFEIKNLLQANFDVPGGYSTRNQLIFNLSNNATLKLDALNVSFSGSVTSNYVIFSGIGNVILDTSNYNVHKALFHISNGTKLTTTDEWNPSFFKIAGSLAALNLGGHFTTNNLYLSSSASSYNTINLNGFDFIQNKTSILYFESSTSDRIHVNFGNDAEGDGQVVFAIGKVSKDKSGYAEGARFVFDDYDAATDLILFYDTSSFDPITLIEITGYTGKIQSQLLTEGEYAGWTSYFIPEPAEYAAIIGFLTLAFVAIRRRK